MSDGKTLKERQVALLLDIERLLLGETPTCRSANFPFFLPHPPQTKPKERTVTRRRHVRTTKVAKQDESKSNETLRDTPTHSSLSATRKAATDHLLHLNSDPKIIEWLKEKEKGLRCVKREKRREEKRRRLEAEAETIAKEERTKLAEEKYVEWSLGKLKEVRERKESNRQIQRSKSSCNTAVNGDKAFDDWLQQKRKQKERKESNVEAAKVPVSEEEKRKRYAEWLNTKQRLDKEKVRRKAEEEERVREQEEEEKRRKEEERARRLSYDEWLKRKREKEEEAARQRKVELEKDGDVDKLNPYSDIAKDLRLKRRMEQQMMKQRVDTGITRPREERRLKQTKDATDFLKEYVERIQLSEMNSDGSKPRINVKHAWSDLGQRPDPQGCEAPKPIVSTGSTTTSLPLVPTLTHIKDSANMTGAVLSASIREKSGDSIHNGKDASNQSTSMCGDADPMSSVV